MLLLTLEDNGLQNRGAAAQNFGAGRHLRNQLIQHPHLVGEGTAAAAKSLQSCPTLCDPIDGCPLRSPVPGILQAKILEWVAIWSDEILHSDVDRDTCDMVPSSHPPVLGFICQERQEGMINIDLVWQPPSQVFCGLQYGSSINWRFVLVRS